MQILNYDKNNNIFKLDIPKINKQKPKQNYCYIVISSIILIGFLFNYKT